ncbi:hypothetical protein QZH41_003298 [Actinostola sp. cb2023]|nr:hypothetical protein QZH41_003298 [Actinostola sp. cb2023]
MRQGLGHEHTIMLQFKSGNNTYKCAPKNHYGYGENATVLIPTKSSEPLNVTLKRVDGPSYPEGSTKHFPSIGRLDQAVYRCTANNGDECPVTDINTTIVVIYEPRITASSDESQKIDENEVVSLTCKASGFPKPTVTWTKDGKVVHTGDRLSRKATPDSAGKYKCSASNGVGKPQIKTFIVEIQDGLETSEGMKTSYTLFYGPMGTTPHEPSKKYGTISAQSRNVEPFTSAQSLSSPVSIVIVGPSVPISIVGPSVPSKYYGIFFAHKYYGIFFAHKYCGIICAHKYCGIICAHKYYGIFFAHKYCGIICAHKYYGIIFAHKYCGIIFAHKNCGTISAQSRNVEPSRSAQSSFARCDWSRSSDQ